MPNWCEGSLRIKGKYEDVLRFFQEGINSYKRGEDYQPVKREKSEWMEIEENDSLCTLVSFHDTNNWIYIEGTKRAFILDYPSYISICVYEDDKTGDRIGVSAIGIRQAWGIDRDDWIELSKKYSLELKLYCIESGMGFYENVHIKDGEILADGSSGCELGHYHEFVWNCPFPWLGG